MAAWMPEGLSPAHLVTLSPTLLNMGPEVVQDKFRELQVWCSASANGMPDPCFFQFRGQT